MIYGSANQRDVRLCRADMVQHCFSSVIYCANGTIFPVDSLILHAFDAV